MYEVECDLQPVREYSTSSKLSPVRFGRYHGSNFWEISGYGAKKWVVAVKIRVNDGDMVDATIEELAAACVAYLNKPPPRQKYGKRQRYPKYGLFELHKASLMESRGKKYISALLITRARKSAFFWGKGKRI